MEDLIKEYQTTLKGMRRQKVQLKTKMMYLNKLAERDPENIEAREEIQRLKAESRVYNEMESDLLFALEWMKSGHMPGIRRGIERRAAYQIDKPMDPLLMQRYFRSEETEYSWDKEEKENCIAYSEQQLIDEMLNSLTEKEKEFYLMSRGNAMTYAAIARNCKLSRQTVQTTVKRAEKKIGIFLSKMKGEQAV